MVKIEKDCSSGLKIIFLVGFWHLKTPILKGAVIGAGVGMFFNSIKKFLQGEHITLEDWVCDVLMLAISGGAFYLIRT